MGNLRYNRVMMFDDFEDDDDEDDLLSEMDAVESSKTAFALPRETTTCRGHEAIEVQIIELVRSGKLPHALIFSGIEGVGKATTAFRVARYLLKHGARQEGAGASLFGDPLPVILPDTMDMAADDPVFRQVASGGHSDLLTVERPMDEKKGKQKDHVDVDSARLVVPFLRMKAAKEGGWRVVILDDADTMNRNAQNAILKVLEEPPERTLLILIAHRLGAMIPTIRSRCRTIEFYPLAKESFADLMGLSGTDLELLYAFSGGSIGQALKLRQSGGLESLDSVVGFLRDYPRWDWIKLHGFAEATGGKFGENNAYESFVKVMQWIVEAMLHTKARGLDLPPLLSGKGLESLYNRYSLTEWIEVDERLKRHFNQTDFGNLDKRQGVLGVFSIL
jgi:DNA polymerase-3 subunit delta'